MTTHVGNPRGRTSTSFLDLPGELRNTVYQHFIDYLECESKPRPACNCCKFKPSRTIFKWTIPEWSDGKASDLASVHQQIQAEFMTLYLHQAYKGGRRLLFNHVHYFLDLFFGRYPNSALRDVTYKFEVRLGTAQNGPEGLEADWSLDLLEVVSIMRHYPLISIAWNLVDNFKEAAFDDSGVMYAVSALKDMDVQLFGKLNSVMLYLNRYIEHHHFGSTEIEAEMPCMLKRGATKQDVSSIKSLLYPTRCRGIEVEISWEGSFRGWSDWESYPEDDWSSNEEDNSDSAEKVADNGEDIPKRRD